MRNKMIRKVLILFILVSYVVSDDCVRYTFEENFNEWLINERVICSATDPFWVVGKYKEIGLSYENNQSTTFMTPLPGWRYSCGQSFSFSMAPGGMIEATIYMEETIETEYVNAISVAAFTSTSNRLLGEAWIASWRPDFVPGWHTLKMILPVADIGEGFILITGSVAPNTIVLIDSLRYVPPGMEEIACRLYDDEPEPVPPTREPTTLPEETAPDQTTAWETTPDPSTPEEATPEPTTPEETTPEPTMPEVTTPEQTTPEVTTPEPTTPEETTPDPTTPEEITPAPITPEETTPDPITQDPTTPEVTTPNPTTPEVTTPETNHRFLLTIETWIKTQLSTSSKTN